MMREKEKADLKMVLQGAWVRGFRWFAFGTETAGMSSPDNCTAIGSLSTAYWPFQNVAEIGVTPDRWNALDPAPKHAGLVAVDCIKVVWVGNRNQDGTSVWHGTIYPRQ
jgi:hypothetical protein